MFCRLGYANPILLIQSSIAQIFDRGRDPFLHELVVPVDGLQRAWELAKSHCPLLVTCPKVNTFGSAVGQFQFL
jgi:hypothetical protein